MADICIDSYLHACCTCLLSLLVFHCKNDAIELGRLFFAVLFSCPNYRLVPLIYIYAYEDQLLED
jgi:hypothetical protein